jgi:hypothetical protein
MNTFKVVPAMLALFCAASFAVAQAPQVVRVRATIEQIDGQLLIAKGRDGASMKIRVTDNTPANEVVRASRSEIKIGSYLAITAMPQPDGSQKAVAILIFPPGVHPPEGFSNWDLPHSTMTNATVANHVTGADGEKLTVKYKDGEKQIVVTPETEIVTYKKATIAALKPGQKIFIFAAKETADGTLQAPNVTFGDYGVWR